MSGGWGATPPVGPGGGLGASISGVTGASQKIGDLQTCRRPGEAAECGGAGVAPPDSGASCQPRAGAVWSRLSLPGPARGRSRHAWRFCWPPSGGGDPGRGRWSWRVWRPAGPVRERWAWQGYGPWARLAPFAGPVRAVVLPLAPLLAPSGNGGPAASGALLAPSGNGDPWQRAYGPGESGARWPPPGGGGPARLAPPLALSPPCRSRGRAVHLRFPLH